MASEEEFKALFCAAPRATQRLLVAVGEGLERHVIDEFEMDAIFAAAKASNYDPTFCRRLTRSLKKRLRAA